MFTLAEHEAWRMCRRKHESETVRLGWKMIRRSVGLLGPTRAGKAKLVHNPKAVVTATGSAHKLVRPTRGNDGAPGANSKAPHSRPDSVAPKPRPRVVVSPWTKRGVVILSEESYRPERGAAFFSHNLTRCYILVSQVSSAVRYRIRSTIRRHKAIGLYAKRDLVAKS